MITEQRGLVPPLIESGCWAEQDEAELVCRQVLDMTHDVKTFAFAPADGGVISFDPGQFLTLRVEVDGEPITRCYTISTPPTRPHLLAITVKRVEGGPVSNWLHDNLVPGMSITALAPLGAFSVANHPAEKYLFLSAGSGITPLMSMTRALYDLGSDADILLINNARTPSDIIFRQELEAMATTAPNIRVVHICEGDYPSNRWAGLRGRLTTAALEALAPDFAERVTFTCGPALYMDSVRWILEAAGYDMRNYHEESFSFEAMPEPDRPVEPEGWAVEADDLEPVATFTVEFTRSGKTIACGHDEYILDAALAAGMRIPSSCGQGMCGTCKVQLLDGQADMQHNGGIRPREIAMNRVLACCSKPLSDLRIDG